MTDIAMLNAILTLIVVVDKGLRSASHQRFVMQAQQSFRGEMSCKGDIDGLP
jgi:hypothetical protein